MRRKRRIKTLLKIMLNNIDLIGTGLCQLAIILSDEGFITKEEAWLIKTYIVRNPPDDAASSSSYWYEWGEKEPRIKWIKNHIKKL